MLQGLGDEVSVGLKLAVLSEVADVVHKLYEEWRQVKVLFVGDEGVELEELVLEGPQEVAVDVLHELDLVFGEVVDFGVTVAEVEAVAEEAEHFEVPVEHVEVNIIMFPFLDLVFDQEIVEFHVL
jgi:hypothetical protein